MLFYKSVNLLSGNIIHTRTKNIKQILLQLSINFKDGLDLFNLNRKICRSNKKDRTMRKMNSKLTNDKKILRLGNDYKFKLFTNVENSILNDINDFNQRIKTLAELKNNLVQPTKRYEEYINNMIISTKVMKLYFLKT